MSRVAQAAATAGRPFCVTQLSQDVGAVDGWSLQRPHAASHVAISEDKDTVQAHLIFTIKVTNFVVLMSLLKDHIGLRYEVTSLSKKQ